MAGCLNNVLLLHYIQCFLLNNHLTFGLISHKGIIIFFALTKLSSCGQWFLKDLEGNSGGRQTQFTKY